MLCDCDSFAMANGAITFDHSALDLGRPDIKCETRNFGVGRPDPGHSLLRR